MKQQILVIHGGDAFKSYEDYLNFLKDYEIDFLELGKKEWKDKLQDDLGENYEIIKPRMPSAWNAKYEEWKIWFEKFFPYLKDGVILIGHSLGGTFLAKYLSENDFPKKIKAVFLVAPIFEVTENHSDVTLGDFALPKSLKKLASQSEKIFLYHSKDDPIVPFSDIEKFAKELPNAEKNTFIDRGHFAAETFPEILEKIKSLR